MALRAADCTVTPDGNNGRLLRALPFGPVTRVLVDLDGSTVIATVANPPPEWLARIPPGTPVGFTAETAATRILEEAGQPVLSRLEETSER